MTTEMTPAMRRSVLIATLRDKTLWPEGFQWDFSDCDRCAMGMLLRQLNMNQRWYMSPKGYEERTGRLLGLTEMQVKDIFSTAPPYKGLKDVTPAMVADRLEEIHRSL